MIKNFLALVLLFSASIAYAGLPPTSSKVSSDSVNVTTFNYQFPNFTGTHTGTTLSLGVNSIAGGGTGQATKSAAFDALSPLTTSGDILYGGASGTGTRLAKGSNGQVLTLSAGVPAWANNGSVFVPTIQKFTSTGTTTGYLFTISTTTTCAVGDTYTNNANTYTVLGALSAQSGQVLFMSGASAPTATGTLARATGSGTSSVTFTANVALATYTPAAGVLYIRVRAAGGGGGGAAGNNNAAGTAGTGTFFGPNIISANGGSGGGFVSTTAAGGSASLGTAIGIAVTGGAGQGSSTNGPAGIFSGGGNGGASGLGGNGGGGYNSFVPVAGSPNTGGGGGGGGSAGATGGAPGGGGGAGGFVDAIITSIAASYPYVVGTGGAGGSAGGGIAGAAGGTGLVEVTEYYQ